MSSQLLTNETTHLSLFFQGRLLGRHWHCIDGIQKLPEARDDRGWHCMIDNCGQVLNDEKGI
jgi:hypothetical protein